MASAPKQMKNFDERLSFEAYSNWQREKNPIWGSDYTIVKPNGTLTEQPRLVEFDFPTSKCFLPGGFTCLRLKGGFMCSDEIPGTGGGGAKEGTVWRAATKADAASVVLAPGWIEHLITECSLFHGNTKISSLSEARYVTPWLNCLLYRLMDSTAKKLIAPQETSHTYCIPDWKKDSWDQNNTTLKTYTEKVFEPNQIEYDWTPLQWPFYQSPNHLMGSLPKIVPLPIMPKLTLRLGFAEDQSIIFRKVNPASKTRYKFSFTDISLFLDEPRLSPSFEKTLLGSKRTFNYPGITRLQIIEPIPNKVSVYKAKYQDVKLPEQLLIVCVNKAIASGTYKFSDDTEQNIFKNHNIQAVNVSFKQQQMYIKSPFPTDVNDDRFRTKSFLDHLIHPVCAVPVDVKETKEIYFKDGSKDTAYPHVLINMTNFGTRSRILPALADDSILNNKSDLDLEFKFTADGSATDCCYVIWAIYTDVAIEYDAKTKLFTNPYSAIIN